MADETIDIRYILNSDEVASDSKKVDAAISGTQNAVELTTEDMRENIAIQKQVLKELEKQYKELEKTIKKSAPGAVRSELEGQLSGIKSDIDAEKQALVELTAAQKQYDASTRSLRTQIMELRNSMATMTEGSQEYIDAMIRLGQLQDKMGDIQQQGRVFADDEKNFRAATESIQGLSGVMSTGVGIATLFGASQDNLAKIQAKLQAVIAISIGVQQVAQILNKDSYFTLVVLAGAKNMVTSATSKMAVALGISNVAAKRLMATLTLGLSVAIGAVIWAINKMSTANEEARKKQEEAREEIKKYNETIAESVSKPLMAYSKLQNEWSKLTSQQQKLKFVKDNKKAFEELGIAVNSVADAENVMVKNSTAVITALMARAKATAAQQLATEKYKKVIEIELDSEFNDNGASYAKEQLEKEMPGNSGTGDKKYQKRFDELLKSYKAQEIAKAKAEADSIVQLSQQYGQDAINALNEAGIREYKSNSDQAANTLSKDTRERQWAVEQARIDAMNEGSTKQLAQIELTRQEKLASIDKEQKDIEAKLKEQGKQLTPEQKASFDTQRTSVGLSANKDTVAVNKKYDDEIADGWRALTDVFLSEEEKRTGSIKNEYENRRKWLDELSKGGSINREEYIKMSLQIDASEAKAELQPLLDQYQTYADKRKKIEEKFQADRKTLQNADGSLKPGVKQGNVDELDNAKEKALQSLKFDEAKEGVDLTKLFGNLDNLTLPSMKTLRDKIKVWIDEAGNSLSPEALKAVSDAFLKLEIKIADKDPFSVLKSSIADYKTSTKEVAEAQELYNKALRENGKDSEVAKQAAEKLTKAQKDRAASLAKANEAIKSVASDGQQIVGAAQDVIGILTDLGVKVPENAEKALGGIGQVMEGLGSIDLMKPMTIVTGAVKMIGGWVTTITSLFGGHKELANELERRNQESREKAYLAELEINQLYRDRYDWAQKIGESNLSYIKRQGEELNNQANANDKEQKDLWDKLSKSEYKSGEHIEKTGLFGWGREIKEDWSSLSGKSWDEIEKLASSGALSEEGMKYYEALKKAREEGEDLRAREQEYLESVREITTGSTYEGVVNGIVEGFKAGKRSAADFADSFEDLMSSAVGSALNSLANEKSRAWFEKFAEMGKDGYTTEETSELKADWIKLNEDLAEEAKNLESITGVSLGGNVQNDNSLTGQIKGSVATEASVAELGGLFRSQADSLLRIDSKMDLGFGELSELARSNAAIEANTRATANNTANTVTTLASGFTAMHTELTAINKNTSKDTGSYGG